MRTFAIFLALGLALASGAGATTLTLICSADTICADTSKGRKVTPGTHVYRARGRIAASGGARLSDLTLWGAKARLTDLAGDKGFFSTFAGTDAKANAFLFSVHIHGFMLTQHRVFEYADAPGNLTTGSPGSYTLYGPPSDGLPQGDE